MWWIPAAIFAYYFLADNSAKESGHAQADVEGSVASRRRGGGNLPRVSDSHGDCGVVKTPPETVDEKPADEKPAETSTVKGET